MSNQKSVVEQVRDDLYQDMTGILSHALAGYDIQSEDFHSALNGCVERALNQPPVQTKVGERKVQLLPGDHVRFILGSENAIEGTIERDTKDGYYDFRSYTGNYSTVHIDQLEIIAQPRDTQPPAIDHQTAEEVREIKSEIQALQFELENSPTCDRKTTKGKIKAYEHSIAIIESHVVANTHPTEYTSDWIISEYAGLYGCDNCDTHECVEVKSLDEILIRFANQVKDKAVREKQAEIDNLKRLLNLARAIIEYRVDLEDLSTNVSERITHAQIMEALRTPPNKSNNH